MTFSHRYLYGFTAKTNCLWKLHCCICYGCEVSHRPCCDGGCFSCYRSARQSPSCCYCSGYFHYMFHCYRIWKLVYHINAKLLMVILICSFFFRLHCPKALFHLFLLKSTTSILPFLILRKFLTNKFAND